MEQVHADIEEPKETELKKRQSSLFYTVILDKDSTYDCTISSKSKKELADVIAKLIESDPNRKICGIFHGKSIAHRPITKIELI